MNSPFAKFDIARNICDHIIGENHTPSHRVAVGGLIMAIGVCIAHFGSHLTHYTVVQLGTDLVGYLVHGIGGIPILESITKSQK